MVTKRLNKGNNITGETSDPPRRHSLIELIMSGGKSSYASVALRWKTGR